MGASGIIGYPGPRGTKVCELFFNVALPNLAVVIAVTPEYITRNCKGLNNHVQGNFI